MKTCLKGALRALLALCNIAMGFFLASWNAGRLIENCPVRHVVNIGIVTAVLIAAGFLVAFIMRKKASLGFRFWLILFTNLLAIPTIMMGVDYYGGWNANFIDFLFVALPFIILGSIISVTICLAADDE